MINDFFHFAGRIIVHGAPPAGEWRPVMLAGEEKLYGKGLESSNP
ncbi:hypothetical protein YPPY66_4932 [Yersinia pestis PY-66]|uniref:Uncharacterized protein n=2 Tax=Yersinia pestis TaxID=632 RepID=A0AAV3BJG1_YERPE|nr:hypothetical protein YPC_0923 [Yersinia pestis biovar Medievalis str. Harbin 35]AEL70805.1 hypothetical protein A1122_00600 [Yersinia pestis A1122]EDR33303.1 hypothetical protein YPIP275_4362 [Yersinia pestis biovar Orientalis str. IP275]EDR58825.1 hypothetical protein YpMG051020_2110 [Yersinia pestis biovar Orientalis str. MG05-1020]EDR62080.1 hypothetical protein YpUG050454_2602 [Yersinia pestis biovar Antiqua str. UG05-0454]EEO75574.1 hypothetical protein YP516_3499 [Yersinia pestis Nepa